MDSGDESSDEIAECNEVVSRSHAAPRAPELRTESIDNARRRDAASAPAQLQEDGNVKPRKRQRRGGKREAQKKARNSGKRCGAFKIKIDASNEQEKAVLIQQHELHLRKAEAARASLKQEKLKAKQDESFYAFTFDLEKALPFPVLSTSLAYYKRNMYVYNFGCHELSSETGHMYVWDETTASRVSQEIGSCVSRHVQARAAHCKHVVAYSDACTGQNRNIKMVLFLMRLVTSESNAIEVIDHKFMVSGHSFLPNDSDFGSVETSARQKTIYGPDDWCEIIKRCRRNKPFHVTEMFRDDFLSSENLEKAILRRKKNEANNPVRWLKIQWIGVTRENPYMLLYKETLSEDIPFSILNLRPNRKGKGGRPSLLHNVPTPPLYKTPRPVTSAKKKDMLDLLPFIPPIHHEYFLNLPTTMTPSENEIGPLTDNEDEESANGEDLDFN